MKRRSLLLGSGAAAAALVGGAALWRPGDEGGPHDPYFAELNELLKTSGPGRPLMLIDAQRMAHNINSLTRSVGAEKTYRVVVKSLPSVPLLREVMSAADTQALMVFHQPFLSEVARAFPNSDVLLGKPMPVAAVRTFYSQLENGLFDPARQVQWLVDSVERLRQYQDLATQLDLHLRINTEIDVGLHRGGLSEPDQLAEILTIIESDPQRLSFSGLMGYEPHLTGLGASLDHPAVVSVLNIYRSFVDVAVAAGYDPAELTLNGAGSHTLRIYENDSTMNDLAAGSGVVMPTDFDTEHLRDNRPALFIATPILKRYDQLKVPGDPWLADALSTWNPNMRRLYYIYGGYWKARMVSPPGVPEPIYKSTNQSPVSTSESVDLQVDDYMFLRPTQSEHVMLQFGDLQVVDNGRFTERWPVFHQTG